MKHKKLKLLYSYDEYKKNKLRICANMSEKTARLLLLSLNFSRTKEEEAEYKELTEYMEEYNSLYKYTNAYYELLDLYFELKNIHDEDKRKEQYQTIGIKFCNLQVMIEEHKLNSDK